MKVREIQCRQNIGGTWEEINEKAEKRKRKTYLKKLLKHEKETG